MIQPVFDPPNPGVRASEARLRLCALDSTIDARRRRYWMLIAFCIGFLGVDLACCYMFNSSLTIGNLLEAPTWLDRAARAVASLMTATVVTAAVLTWHSAGNARLGGWVRLAAGLLALGLALGAVLIAAAVAYPVFGELVEGLLTGSAPSPGSTAAPSPVWVHLLSAAPVIAAGVMVGALELAALAVSDELVEPRADRARCAEIVRNDDAALAALKHQLRGDQRRVTPQHESQAELARRMHAVIARLGTVAVAYLEGLESSRPLLRDEAVLTPQEWDRQCDRQSRYEAARASASRLLDSHDVERIVRQKLMPPAEPVRA